MTRRWRKLRAHTWQLFPFFTASWQSIFTATHRSSMPTWATTQTHWSTLTLSQMWLSKTSSFDLLTGHKTYPYWSFCASLWSEYYSTSSCWVRLWSLSGDTAASKLSRFNTRSMRSPSSSVIIYDILNIKKIKNSCLPTLKKAQAKKKKV